MKLTITKYSALCLIVSSLLGCGAFSDDTTIEIQMYGVAKTPTGAVGDRDPQFQSYELLSITLDGSASVLLLNESTTFKIVDRPQILLEQSAKSLIGQTYTGLTAVFAPTVTGGTIDKEDHTFTMTLPTLALVENLVFEEGKSKTFLIKASWANTISADGMSEPTLELTLQ